MVNQQHSVPPTASFSGLNIPQFFQLLLFSDCAGHSYLNTLGVSRVLGEEHLCIPLPISITLGPGLNVVPDLEMEFRVWAD